MMIEKWKFLPEGILIDILAWLPIKSIARFRCVSKKWCKYYFRNPDFINLHVNRSIQMDYSSLMLTKKVPASSEDLNPVSFHSLDYNISGDYLKFDKSVSFPSAVECKISFPYWKSYMSIVGSCNGLLCVQSDPDTLYVLNPITGEHEKLPQVPDVYLGPVVYVRAFGFGFDCKADAYKVVKFFTHMRGRGSKAWIYTLGTKSWRKLRDIPYEFHLSKGLQTGLFVNGALHWMVHSHRVDKPIRFIVSFDVGDEKFREIQLPTPLSGSPESENYYYRTSISLLDSNLCLSWNAGDGTGSVDVWVTKNYGVLESWTKLFRISRLREDTDYMRLIQSFKNGDILFFSKPLNRSTHYNGDLILYSPVSGNIRFLDTSDYQKLEDACTYAGSLVPVRQPSPRRKQKMKQKNTLPFRQSDTVQGCREG